MIPTPPSRRKAKSEEGYVLVAVVFMMVILILSLSVAIPKVREDIQRDRDEETMHRGQQYIRAIQLYYRKFHAYPPNADALVKTNDIRFLRKKYIDPTTRKDEWKPIMWGQNKTPMAMGFFGQPLAAAIGGGIGPGGGNLAGQNGGGSSLSNTNSGGSSAFGSPTVGATGTPDQSGAGATAGAGGGTDANGNPTPGTGTTSTTGSAFGSSGNATGNGQTFGGAGIIGFSPQSPKQSIYVYKKKNHYNEWEFLYSPQMDQQQMAAGSGLNGQPASGTQTNGTTFGPTTTPTPPTNPTTPQQ
ncbi:MAG TPA: type II secretion system protein [Terracidiphilus sp.]|jgi:type II secretory pathway pseudopilin PulG